MQITTDILDVAAYEEKKIKPHTFVQREGATWVTRDLPIDVAGACGEEWGTCNEGEAVRIPLFPYLTAVADPAIVLASLFELGVKAREYLSDYKIDKLHFAIGHPVTEEKHNGKNMFRFWLGFGCSLKGVK